MSVCKLGLVGLIVGFLAPWASAAEVENIYQQSALVPSQSVADRRAGAGDAMATVLVRLSGTVAVLAHPDIRTALASADRYLRQFSYTREKYQPTGARGGDAKMVSGYRLTMGFQPRPLNELLKRSGQPVWSVNRPRVLAWIEVDAGGSRALLSGAEAQEGWREALASAASRRGLPLITPTGAATDALAYAEQAGADVVLAGQVSLTPGRCVAQWRSGSERWTANGEQFDDCVDQAMDSLAEALSAQYAFTVTAGEQSAVPVEVSGVDSFKAYGDVLLLLQGLAAVESVAVLSIENDRVYFNLISQAGPERIERAIRLKHLLVEMPAEAPTDALIDTPLLRYSYVNPAAAGELTE